MAGSVEERIAGRKAIADEKMQQQGFFGRFFNRAGLMTANGVDRLSPLTDMFAFIGGSVMGALRGATLGGVAWAILFSFSIIPATMLGGIPAAFVVMGAGAAAFGLLHGVAAVKYQESHKNGRRPADRIAQKTGAIPERAPSQEQGADAGYTDQAYHAALVRARRREEQERQHLREENRQERRREHPRYRTDNDNGRHR